MISKKLKLSLCIPFLNVLIAYIWYARHCNQTVTKKYLIKNVAIGALVFIVYCMIGLACGITELHSIIILIFMYALTVLFSYIFLKTYKDEQDHS